MDWYETEVRELEQSRVLHPPTANPAVFYGSSSLRLWDTLAVDLGEPSALNLAFGGSTLDACVHFFERLIPPVAPASLVVYAGDNDLGDGRRPEDVLRSYLQLGAKVQGALGAIPFGFISIKPSPARMDIQDRIRLTNDWVRREMERIPGAYMIDVFGPMLDPAGRPRAELFLDDGLHLSRAGYLLWIDVLQPFRHLIFFRK
jgi:lysophospholipase L1-like esterase